MLQTMLLAAAIAVGSWIHTPGGTWTPDASTMTAVKSAMRGEIARQLKASHATLERGSEYTYQYQGITLDGYRLVLIMGSCTPLAERHRKGIQRIADGGTCYFQAYFDPKRKRFAGFQFNGEA